MIDDEETERGLRFVHRASEVGARILLWVCAGAFLGCLVLGVIVGVLTALERCP